MNHELTPDEIHLKGRLQVGTALEALQFTGLNPSAQEALGSVLILHDQVSSGEETDQVSLSFYLQGGEAAAMRADILMSLEAVATDVNTVFDRRQAASFLMGIITSVDSV